MDDIFYIQDCLGKNGKSIKIYKFKTMEDGKNLNINLEDLDSLGKKGKMKELLGLANF